LHQTFLVRLAHNTLQACLILLHLVNIWWSCTASNPLATVNSAVYRTSHAFLALKDTVEMLHELN